MTPCRTTSYQNEGGCRILLEECYTRAYNIDMNNAHITYRNEVAASASTAVRVLGRDEMDGVSCLTVPCPEDYETFRTLPQAVTFDGRTYGLTGFNSDRHVAYYRSDAAVAGAR